MPGNRTMRLLPCMLCLALALTPVACSEDTDRAACEGDIEELGVNYYVQWQNSQGDCVADVSGSIMYELQCEPGHSYEIKIGLTEEGTPAPINESGVKDLSYLRTDSMLAELPTDAIRTGLFSRGRELFIAQDRESAYVRHQQGKQGIEVWQRFNDIGCSSPNTDTGGDGGLWAFLIVCGLMLSIALWVRTWRRR